MNYMRGQVLNYPRSVKCYICKNRNLEWHDYFFHCDTCRGLNGKGPKFDICANCVLIRNDKIKHNERVRCHALGKCELKREKPVYRGKWNCEGRKYKAGGKGCLKGITKTG